MTTHEHQFRLVTYQDWNLPYGEPDGEPYGEDEAHRRHKAGEQYYVLIGDPAKPDAVIEAQPGRAGIEVNFLDSRRRETLTYYFVGGEYPDSDDLFLQQTTIKTYDGDAGPPVLPASSETWYFRPDGSQHGFRQTNGGPTESTEGSMAPDEVAKTLVEPMPEFGDWDSITRYDR